MLFPDNFGKDMSLDETCLSNGEVYTILTNKAAHGGKGALAAMVRDSRKEVGEIKKVVSLCYEYRYTTLTGKLDATSRYAYSL